MTIVAAAPDRIDDPVAVKRREWRTLGVACGAHALHDGYTDLVWVALPIWQAEFGLTYAVVGLLRMIYTGTMASLQIPATYVSGRLGAPLVLGVGTALAGLCYCLAGLGDGFWLLVGALFLGGLGAATQHPIASALVTRVFTGERGLTLFGTYNFAGDVGKVLLPACATALLLVLPWRSAYGLLGLVGLVAAVAVFVLTPRLGPQTDTEKKPSVHTAAAWMDERQLRRGLRILVAFGMADSVVRGAFFVLLPFLLIGKGATVASAGFGLTLVFLGGAAGKLACGWIARSVGIVATIVVAQILTATGIAALLLLPLNPALALLPLVGLALNGVTTVVYGSVPSYVTPERREHALSVFYTLAIGSAAVAPPLSGLVGDVIGIFNGLVVVAMLTVATIPLAFGLRTPANAPA